jgi:argininosuccinate lyase
MLAMASDPQMLATDLAEYLAAKGLPFRDAHGAVARLMRTCAERNVSPAQVPLAELRTYSPLFGEDAYALLTPQASVAQRRSAGGTWPEGVAERAARLAKGQA